MDLDAISHHFFGTTDIDTLSPEALEAGRDRVSLAFGTERDSGRRFALWAVLRATGDAPDPTRAFKDRGSSARRRCMRPRSVWPAQTTRRSGRAAFQQRTVDPPDQVRDRGYVIPGSEIAMPRRRAHPLADQREDILFLCHRSGPFRSRDYAGQALTKGFARIWIWLTVAVPQTRNARGVPAFYWHSGRIAWFAARGD